MRANGQTNPLPYIEDRGIEGDLEGHQQEIIDLHHETTGRPGPSVAAESSQLSRVKELDRTLMIELGRVELTPSRVQS